MFGAASTLQIGTQVAICPHGRLVKREDDERGKKHLQGLTVTGEPFLATPKASSAATPLHSPTSPMQYFRKRARTAGGLALMM